MKDDSLRLARHVSLLYCVVAVAWILVSDRIVAAFFSDSKVVEEINIFKGWGFVAVTAALLYSVLRRVLRKQQEEALTRMKAEQVLREQQEQYRKVVELSTAAIFTVHDGKFLLVNSAAVRLFGASQPGQLLGRQLFDFVHPDFHEIVRQRFKQSQIQNGSMPLLELNMMRLDDLVVNVESSCVQFQSEGATTLLVEARDITKRKKSEEALRLFRDLIDRSNDAFEIIDPATGRYLDVNQRGCIDLGYSRDELLSLAVFDVDIMVKKSDWKQTTESLQQSGFMVFNGVHRRKDGSTFPVEVKIQLVILDRHYLVSVVRDMSERKMAEKKLRQLSHAVEQSPVSVVITDIHGNIEYVNRKFTEVTGYSAAEVEGRNPRILKSGELTSYAYKELWKSIAAGRTWTGEFHNRKKNGELFWESASISPILDDTGRPTHFVAVKEDITESRQKTIALTRLAGIVEHSEDAIIGEDFDGNITSWNKGAERIFGYSASEMVGSLFMRLVPDGQHNEERLHLMQVMRCEQVEHSERILLAKAGRPLTVAVTVSPIKDTSGNLVGTSKVMRDITRQKLAEESLRASEERFRLVTENASDLITVINSHGIIRFQSPSVEHVLGYKPEEWLNRDGLELVHPEDIAKAAGALQRIVANPDEPPFLVEFRFLHKDGTWRIMQAIGKKIPSQAKESLIVINSRDITENRKLEEQLRQSQKMEAIGQLAGGVAHDFNNILAVIIMQAGMLRAGQNLASNEMDYAGEIEKAAQRAANLTRQLLLFSRRQTLQPSDLNLNDAVANLTKMLQRLLGEDIELQLKYASHPLLVHADTGMIDQILMNLAINSRDAMPKGGQLVIETAAVEIDGQTVTQIAQARPGSYVCLSVSDTGCGIPPEILPHIFEPFFTTKDVGKGTGLGLATVFGIVQQHQGWINVYSEAGLGTTFRIYLPRRPVANGERKTVATLATKRGGDETILLVEDDDALRPSVHRALSSLGYRVIDATSGVEALDMWRQYHAPIHLLLTDLVMPDGMNGKELVEKLQQLNPKLKVIYTSGYSVEVAGRNLTLDEGVNFLAKPYEAHKLAETVRNCLDKI